MKTIARPIFVVGSPRSGTSVLTWCLGRHPNILPLEESNWMGKLALELLSTYELGTSRGERSQLSSMGVTADDFCHSFGELANAMILGYRWRFEQLSDQWAVEHPELVSDAFKLSHAADEPKQRWVDGTPEYSFQIPGLLSLFPNAKFVHVLRDWRSVVRSLLNFSPVAGFDLVRDSRGAIEYWLRTVQACAAAERAYGSDTVVRIRYNDLVTSPKPTLRACLGALGEEFAPSCLEPLRKKINGSPPGSWSHHDADDGELVAQAERLNEELLAEGRPSYPRDPAAVVALEAAFRKRSRYLAALDLESERALITLARAEQELAERRRPTLGEHLRQVIRDLLPYDASVVVVAAGEDELLSLHGRPAVGFPFGAEVPDDSTASAESSAAVEQLEALRADGADFLLVPSTAFNWLKRCASFRAHLETRYRRAWRDRRCAVYQLFDCATAVKP